MESLDKEIIQRFKESNPKSKALVEYLQVIKINYNLIDYKNTIKDLR